MFVFIEKIWLSKRLKTYCTRIYVKNVIFAAHTVDAERHVKWNIVISRSRKR